MEPIRLTVEQLTLFAWYLLFHDSGTKREQRVSPVYLRVISLRFATDAPSKFGLGVYRNDAAIDAHVAGISEAFLSDALWTEVEALRSTPRDSPPTFVAEWQQRRVERPVSAPLPVPAQVMFETPTGSSRPERGTRAGGKPEVLPEDKPQIQIPVEVGYERCRAALNQYADEVDAGTLQPDFTKIAAGLVSEPRLRIMLSRYIRAYFGGPPQVAIGDRDQVLDRLPQKRIADPRPRSERRRPEPPPEPEEPSILEIRRPHLPDEYPVSPSPLPPPHRTRWQRLVGWLRWLCWDDSAWWERCLWILLAVMGVGAVAMFAWHFFIR